MAEIGENKGLNGGRPPVRQYRRGHRLSESLEASHTTGALLVRINKHGEEPVVVTKGRDNVGTSRRGIDSGWGGGGSIVAR